MPKLHLNELLRECDKRSLPGSTMFSPDEARGLLLKLQHEWAVRVIDRIPYGALYGLTGVVACELPEERFAARMAIARRVIEDYPAIEKECGPCP